MTPEEHIGTIGEILTLLRTSLTGAVEKKGSWTDYLRLLEFYRETHHGSAGEIYVHWVEREDAGDME
jgi:hypothetical protein